MPQRLKPDSTSESNDLRNAGLKVTLPRLKILDILADGSARHMSAEDIYKKLLVSNEDIGLATVYRVLTQFEAAGLVTRHHFEGGMAVFELNQGAVDTVKEGMTRSQVRYLLGTPMVADSFNKERWDYIYYLKKGRTRHVDSRRVTVYFDGEKVARLDKPTDAQAAQQDKSLQAIKSRRIY